MPLQAPSVPGPLQPWQAMVSSVFEGGTCLSGSQMQEHKTHLIGSTNAGRQVCVCAQSLCKLWLFVYSHMDQYCILVCCQLIDIMISKCKFRRKIIFSATLTEQLVKLGLLYFGFFTFTKKVNVLLFFRVLPLCVPFHHSCFIWVQRQSESTSEKVCEQEDVCFKWG